MTRFARAGKIIYIKEQINVALVGFDVVNHGRLRMRATALEKAAASLAFERITQKRHLTQLRPLLGLI
jgi:hypothetical protein